MFYHVQNALIELRGMQMSVKVETIISKSSKL
jgi:hypothetical protein